MNKIGGKSVNKELFESAKRYIIKDLYTGEVTETESNVFSTGILGACDSKVIRITLVS